MKSCADKLGKLSPLSATDQRDLLALEINSQEYRRGSRLCLPLGDPATIFLSQGTAFRSVITRRGNRQITELLLPGDIISIEVEPLEDHLVQIEPASLIKVIIVKTALLEEVLQRSSALARAFRAASRAKEITLQRRIVSLGQFDGRARIAELLCDFWKRADDAGLIVEDRAPFPLTQCDIADATGITSVHANRLLKQMREQGVIKLNSQVLCIPVFRTLAALCEYP